MTVQDRPWWSIDPPQDVVVDGDRRRCMNMNETNRSPVACGERQVQTIWPSAWCSQFSTFDEVGFSSGYLG